MNYSDSTREQIDICNCDQDWYCGCRECEFPANYEEFDSAACGNKVIDSDPVGEYIQAHDSDGRIIAHLPDASTGEYNQWIYINMK